MLKLSKRWVPNWIALRRQRLSPDLTSLLLASDLHGSNACFRKLVALAKELCVSAVVIAGDWSGKREVFINARPDGSGWWCDPEGGVYSLGPRELSTQLEDWRDRGVYPVTLEGTREHTGHEQANLVRQLRARRLQQWLDYGEQETSQQGLAVFVIPGNDDGPEIDAVLSTHPWVCNLDGRVVPFRGYELLGLGYSNPTPWETVRELPEEELEKRLTSIAGQVQNWRRAIAVVHVPPISSGIDTAPELMRLRDGTLRPTGELVPVGSTAVREFFRSHQPLAGLSGHCHDARGFGRISSTVCINAGSQYQLGLLSACLLRLDGERIFGQQFLLR